MNKHEVYRRDYCSRGVHKWTKPSTGWTRDMKTKEHVEKEYTHCEHCDAQKDREISRRPLMLREEILGRE
jgi:hypothetical protein